MYHMFDYRGLKKSYPYFHVNNFGRPRAEMMLIIITMSPLYQSCIVPSDLDCQGHNALGMRKKDKITFCF